MYRKFQTKQTAFLRRLSLRNKDELYKNKHPNEDEQRLLQDCRLQLLFCFFYEEQSHGLGAKKIITSWSQF